MAGTRRGHVGAALSTYLDGRLSARERSRVEAHLALCADCREELASLRHTVGLLRQLPTAVPRRSFALPAEAAPSLSRWTLLLAPGRLRLATAVAGLLLLAVIVADLFRVFPVAPAPALPSTAIAPGARGAAGPQGPAGPAGAAADLARPGPEATAAPKAMATPLPAPAPTVAPAAPFARPEAATTPSPVPRAVAPAPQVPEEDVRPAAAYRWPVRQLELALLGAVVALVGLLLFATWRRVRAL